MSSSAKRQVSQRLHDMGFSHNDIRAALAECGYNTEACADWIVNRKHDKKPRLFVGMEVWIFSSDDNDWCPGNVVSITKQLLSIIFNGNDFRWLEKESDIYRIQDEKPLATSSRLHNANKSSARHSNRNGAGAYGDEEMADDPDPYSAQQGVGSVAGPDGMQQGYTAPRNDETDYFVTFTESVLGLELYSDEDGFNCIVGRCVSTIARNKVTPGSQIVQVNDRWLANYRFEEIRDAVKQAARQPPLAVTFRIKKSLLRRPQSASNGQKAAQPPPQDANNDGSGVPNTANLFSPTNPYQNYDASASATSPDTPNNHKLSAPQNPRGHSAEEKRSQPQLNGNNAPAIDEADEMGPLSFAECDALQIGDHVDHRDDVGRFLLATIVDREAYRVKIHYEGWNSKWDTWCDFKAETHRFARPRSVSRRPNTRFGDLKIRDYVDINPVQRHLGWRVGQIRRMDKYSGQAQIVYKEEGQEFLYWAHLNNPREIAPFMTRAAETIALQQKIAEFNEEENGGVGQGGFEREHEDVGSPEDMSGSVNVNPLHGGNGLRAGTAYTGNSMNTSQRANTVNTMNTQNTMSSGNVQGGGGGQGVQGQYSNGSVHHPQPPSANGLGMAPMGGQKRESQYSGRPSGASHSKSRSRVLPKTIKNKKLPPKPAKSPKKRNKNVNRSRTQPLPTESQQQNGSGYQPNGYGNAQQNGAYAMGQPMPMQQNGYAPQSQNGYVSQQNGYAMPVQGQQGQQVQGQYGVQRSASQQQQYNMPHQQPAMKQNGYTAQW